MDPRRTILALFIIAASACAGAAPNPHSIEACDERTARAFRESLKGDTIFVRDWYPRRHVIACRADEAAASCEARARADRLRSDPSTQPVVGCANEPGGYCLVVRHKGDVFSIYGKGTTWGAIAQGLWDRWGSDEVDVITSSVGAERRAAASAPRNDESPRSMIFFRRGSRERARDDVKAAAPAFSALRINLRGGDDSAPWFLVSASCRPKDEPHPSTHEGPWYCFAGPADMNELTAAECFATEAKCAVARDDLREELRMRGAGRVEIGGCSAAAQVSCYEVNSEYMNTGGWQSRRSFYCYPSPQRCEAQRPESPLLHASVRSPCFSARE